MMPTAPPPSDSSHSRKTSTKEDALASSFHDFSVTSTTKQLDGLLTPTPQFGNPDDEEAAETMEFCRQLKEQAFLKIFLKTIFKNCFSLIIFSITIWNFILL